ncbi:MAG TPA: hypothetical protein VKF42_08975 [Chitinivibrionales bacterium]|nr:hypothetical protein [Chitinivibrionales bacterium]
MKLENPLVQKILLFLIGLIAWGNVANFGFVWDDTSYIVYNQSIKSPANVPGYFFDISTMSQGKDGTLAAVFRPLRNLSYFLDYAVAGLRPAWWHIHNLLLHLIAVFLVYYILRRLIGGHYAAFLGSLLYLLHPVQVEAVAWIKGRDDLLSMLFILSALAVWIKTVQFTLFRMVLLCMLFLCACLSKEQAIVFPVLLCLYEILRAPRLRENGAWVRNLVLSKKTWALCALFIIAGGYLAWRTMVMGKIGQGAYLAGDLHSTMLTMIRVAVYYVRLVVGPVHFFVDYAWITPSHSWHEWRVLASVCILAVIGVAAFLVRKKHFYSAYGVLWFFVCLLPVSNIVPTMQYMAERFLYMPLFGVALLYADIVKYCEQRWRTATVAVSTCMILFLGVQTIQRASIWRSDSTLFGATARETGYQLARPYFNWVAALLKQGKGAEALPHAQAMWNRYSTSSSISKLQLSGLAHNLGAAYLLCNEVNKALVFFHIAYATDSTNAYNALCVGLAEEKAGNSESALKFLDRSLLLEPNNSTVIFERGLVLKSLGNFTGAENAFRESLAITPTEESFYCALFDLLCEQKMFAEAEKVLNNATARWPADSNLAEKEKTLQSARK